MTVWDWERFSIFGLIFSSVCLFHSELSWSFFQPSRWSSHPQLHCGWKNATHAAGFQQRGNLIEIVLINIGQTEPFHSSFCSKLSRLLSCRVPPLVTFWWHFVTKGVPLAFVSPSLLHVWCRVILLTLSLLNHLVCVHHVQDTGERTARSSHSWVGEKMSGPHHGPGKHLCSCVYHFYIYLISFCVFLCVPQTNTCQRAPLSAPNIRITVLFLLSCVLPWGLSHVDQRMHRKNRKGKKKNCLLVSFQPQWNVTDKYFFFTSLHLKSESTLGM